MNTEDNKINRRELMSSSLVAGIALTFGMLGVSSQVKGQQGKLIVKGLKLDRPNLVKEEIIPVSKFKPTDFSDFKNKLMAESHNVNKMTSNDSYENPVQALKAIEVNQNDKIVGHENFLKNNVEDLLDQAATLLERGIKDRNEWDNLSIRIFYLDLEINQFLELDELHDKEIESGYYNQELQNRINALNIENLNKEKFLSLAEMFADMYQKRWSEETVRAYVDNKATLAETAGGTRRDTNPQQKSLTLATEEYDMAVQKVFNFVQKEGLVSAKDQSKFQAKLLRKQVNWETVNRDYRMLRTDIDRKYEYIKLASLKADDGVLNLKKRKDPLQKRFSNDFEEARVRLEVAQKGLAEIYGYTELLPSNPASVDFFDECILWTRNAINWLIRFSRIDQSFILPVSLKMLVNDNTWKNGLEKEEIEFEITESAFFEKFRYVRLKGVSIFFDMHDKRSRKNFVCRYNGSIQSEIQVPKDSYYRHSDDSKISVDQTHVPTLKYNRIGTRNFIRQPDIVGTSVFDNLSPFGKWSLNIMQTQNKELLKNITIDDIFVDFFVTAKRINEM